MIRERTIHKRTLAMGRQNLHIYDDLRKARGRDQERNNSRPTDNGCGIGCDAAKKSGGGADAKGWKTFDKDRGTLAPKREGEEAGRVDTRGWEWLDRMIR